MKTKSLKSLAVAIALLGGIGAVSPAMATLTPVQTLGAEFAGSGPRVDTWTFTCPIFHNGRATVQDTAPVNFLNRVQVVLGKNSVTNQVQDNSLPILSFGEGNAFSSAAVVNGGGGLYAATFKKTLPAAEGYIGNLYCVNVFTGAIFNPPLGTNIIRQIDQ